MLGCYKQTKRASNSIFSNLIASNFQIIVGSLSLSSGPRCCSCSCSSFYVLPSLISVHTFIIGFLIVCTDVNEFVFSSSFPLLRLVFAMSLCPNIPCRLEPCLRRGKASRSSKMPTDRTPLFPTPPCWSSFVIFLMMVCVDGRPRSSMPHV